MTDHDRAIQLAAISIDFELTPEEHGELEEHLATCPSCESRAAELRSDAAALAALPRFDAPERVRLMVLSGDRARRWRPAFAIQALVVAVLAIVPLALAAVALRDLNFGFGTGAGQPGDRPPSIAWQRLAIPSAPDAFAFEAHAVTHLPGGGIVTVGLACASLTEPSGCRAASAVLVAGDTWSQAGPDESLAVARLPNGSWVGMRDVSPGGPGVVAVGVIGDEGRPRAAVWLSSDGIRWDRVADDPGFADAWMNSVIALDDGTLLAVGGTEDANGLRAAVWTSADGRAWTRVPDEPAFDVGSAEAITAGRPVAGMWDVSAGPEGVAAVGAGCPPEQVACTALAWISADGRMWTRLPDAMLGDGGATAVASFEGAFLAVGRRPTGGVTWRSTESGAWTLRALPPARSGGLLTAAPMGTRLVAAGEPGSERSGVWTTVDGLVWTFERGELFDGATVLGLGATGDEIIAVGWLGEARAVSWFGRDLTPEP